MGPAFQNKENLWSKNKAFLGLLYSGYLPASLETEQNKRSHSSLTEQSQMFFWQLELLQSKVLSCAGCVNWHADFHCDHTKSNIQRRKKKHLQQCFHLYLTLQEQKQLIQGYLEEKYHVKGGILFLELQTPLYSLLSSLPSFSPFCNGHVKAAQSFPFGAAITVCYQLPLWAWFISFRSRYCLG